MPDEGSATTLPGPGAGTVATTRDDGIEIDGLGEQTTPELLPRSGPLRRVFHALGVVEQTVGATLVVVILALVLLQVAQRYLPGGGWAWTGEIARFAMVWVAFVLSGYLLATDGHVAIKVVDFILHGRAHAAVLTMGHLVIGVTSVLMVYATIDFTATDRGQVTAAAEIPLAVIYAIPALGFTSTALRALLAILVLDVPLLAGRREATA